MILTCERCDTRFRLDESRLPARGARVRCSRCKHAFFVKPAGAPTARRWSIRSPRRPRRSRVPPAPAPSWDLEEDPNGPHGAAAREARTPRRGRCPRRRLRGGERLALRGRDAARRCGRVARSAERRSAGAPAIRGSQRDLPSPNSATRRAGTCSRAPRLGSAVSARPVPPVRPAAPPPRPSKLATVKAPLHEATREPEERVDAESRRRGGAGDRPGLRVVSRRVAVARGSALCVLVALGELGDPRTGAPPAAPQLGVMSVGGFELRSAARAADRECAWPVRSGSCPANSAIRVTRRSALGTTVAVSLLDRAGRDRGRRRPRTPTLPAQRLREEDPARCWTSAEAAARAGLADARSPERSVAVEAVFTAPARERRSLRGGKTTIRAVAPSSSRRYVDQSLRSDRD